MDSPVLVMDERAEYVIPLLSGHVGGAVEIAREIAGSVGAKPVITTATDVEQVFAVDVFAADNRLRIGNRTTAKQMCIRDRRKSSPHGMNNMIVETVV